MAGRVLCQCFLPGAVLAGLSCLEEWAAVFKVLLLLWLVLPECPLLWEMGQAVAVSTSTRSLQSECKSISHSHLKAKFCPLPFLALTSRQRSIILGW